MIGGLKYENRGEMRILIIVGVLLIILAGTCAAASLSNSESGTWKYQLEVPICENSGETLRDYQVLVELSGSDFPEEAQPDGDDIRFTDAGGRRPDGRHIRTSRV
ncbi:MAG: hypothetical protein LAKADJCE_00422 [Candidatus Argoarchaeum ethanivorans]|uniref:Uncharacterized protein n=1 Tax=Candidatus Argoarchaeum ethanivorans TaxID=2608793 RepID=A0A811T703_9EURY|nr:MAG: hypothetical protein LAKADJCE_00422 [Candidatus Argoarchaeum ethanivorans]